MVQGKQTVSDKEMLSYFEENTDPVYSAVELELVWDMGEEGIRQRLNDLVDEGQLDTKKMGSSARVYWLPSASESA